MKIKTKFIIAIALLVLLPTAFTVAVTSNILDDNLDFVHFFDTYFDIFNTFTVIAEDFDTVIEEKSANPTYFLTDAFTQKIAQDFDNKILYIEIFENSNLRYSSHLDTLEDLTPVETFLASRISPTLVQKGYTLKQHHFKLEDASVIDVRLNIDTLRLELAYQSFEVIFFLFFGAFNLIVLSLLIAWISNPIKRSLRRLSYATNEIGKGNLNIELSYNENDDFEPLAESIESMRQSLKRSVARQQQVELEKKELIANISHDLRTPVTSIRGYVQGLKDGVARTRDTQQEYLEIIESKTYMLESLVNDLSEITGYDTNAIKLNKQSIDLRHFLFDCVDELEKDVSRAGGKIHLHYIIKDTVITVDPEKLMRVFINIIENAIKYKSAAPLEIVILANRDDNGVFINISDNGIGVPESDLDKIFNRFFRSDKSRNLDIGGSGIGLSICREIIQAHGGRITATTGTSGGLTLSIRLSASQNDTEELYGTHTDY